jgi:hypothetical protein
MTRTRGYADAAGWLQQISGVDPQANYTDKDAKDPILRDLREMKDAETDATNNLPLPRRSPRISGRNSAHNNISHMQQQPKPKFVAHKDPTRAKKGKDKVVSNRLGGEHMA